MLTNYNGKAITYDAIGNPLNWRNAFMLEWYGRNLITFAKPTGEMYAYTYNADGIRTSKNYYNAGGNLIGTDEYIYDGTKLIAENRSGTWLYYFYDASGAISGMSYNGTLYYFRKNLQGDVTGIYNASGNIITQYEYTPYGAIFAITDANGNDISANATHIANINPIRYRGYYYDTETELYYLQSRYYDPVVGRFLNADSVIAGVSISTHGFNMFSYCFNNPVNMIDDSGTWPSWDDIIDAVEKAVDWMYDNIVEPVEDFIEETIDYLTVPSKEEHYNRNENNDKFPEEYDEEFFKDWDDSVSAKCHQFSAPKKDNVKYVSPDGKKEAIYDVDNKLVTDPRDIGTYNFVSPKEDGIGHFIKDVIPWIKYGNSPDDSTKWWQRAFSFIGVYE